ncbi:hypothetical protein RHGRI_022315 [Rhododendron griersonianum]|uniref:Uncharacterized protein n=1 Tax=Rhododendron griersonianum TaxID=479676 RepID=A0AAV6J1I6_9ERIC|nr:hypothetical protein RHGRI_022315 [Rhododendron griersonianum]
MVAVARKRLVLVAFFLLCFISITAKGKIRDSITFSSCMPWWFSVLIDADFNLSLLRAASRSVPKESRNGADQKGDGNETFSPKAKGEVSEGNSTDQDLATMDYTPAQKRPPIHN